MNQLNLPFNSLDAHGHLFLAAGRLVFLKCVTPICIVALATIYTYIGLQRES